MVLSSSWYKPYPCTLPEALMVSEKYITIDAIGICTFFKHGVLGKVFFITKPAAGILAQVIN